MSALSVDPMPDPGSDWDDLVRLWEETDAPEGSKVEIIEGIVTVSPPPANNHNFIAHRIQRQLYSVIPEDWGIYQTLGAAIPSRTSIYIPDLAVVADEVVRGDEEGHYVPAAAAELVVEVTSPSNARHDRTGKIAGYARAAVPLYLLVDRHAPGGPTVTLYGEPKGEVYRVLSAGKFGEPVHVPEPFNISLDTARWSDG